MAKPVIGSTGWGGVLNDHLDDMATDIAGKEPAGLSAETEAALSASYAAVFTPEKYGAVGDGVADDTAGVQAALTAAVAAGGGVLFLGAKTYRITAPLTVTNTTGEVVSGPRIEGAGLSRTTILCDFDSGAAFDITGCQVSPASLSVFMRGGGIRDLSITQASGRTGVVGIKAIGWWYADIAGLDVEVSSHAIHIPLRADINSNPDYYACSGWSIHHNDLSLNGGKGIYGEAGLGFSNTQIVLNRITNNLSDGVWVAGHNNRVAQNAIVANGRYDETTQGPASGVVCDFVTGQAVPNGFVCEQNELQGNVTDNVRIVACAGFSVARNRLLSDLTTVSSVTAVYPPLHVALGVAGTVQPVLNGLLAGNYHRSTTTGSHPLSLYKPGHTSATGSRIEGAQAGSGDNTSAMVKYDGFNTNHDTEIVEAGELIQPAAISRHYLGRLRAAVNVTGAFTTIAFDNEWQDPDSLNDTSLGFLTPYLGVYEVKVALTISGLAAGNTVTLAVALAGNNAKEYEFAAAGLANETFQFSCRIYASPSQRITVRAKQNSGADKAVRVGDAYNEFSVVGLR